MLSYHSAMGFLIPISFFSPIQIFFVPLQIENNCLPQIPKTVKKQVLNAMRKTGKPVSAENVTKMMGADRKEADKTFAELKKEGATVSPIHCKRVPVK